MAELRAQMASALNTTDLIRKEANGHLDPKRKSALGQFMTPSTVAKYMVSLFQARPVSTVRLLDPGAGIGSLSAAFLERFLALEGVERIDVAAYEIDEVMQTYLTAIMKKYHAPARASGVELRSNVIADDAMCRPLLRSKRLPSDSDRDLPAGTEPTLT